MINELNTKGEIPEEFRQWIKDTTPRKELFEITPEIVANQMGYVNGAQSAYRKLTETKASTPSSFFPDWVTWRTNNGWEINVDRSWSKNGFVKDMESLFALYESEKEKATKASRVMLSNVPDQQGIQQPWLQIWAEVENWYGDPKKRERGAQLLQRLQERYPINLPSNEGEETNLSKANARIAELEQKVKELQEWHDSHL